MHLVASADADLTGSSFIEYLGSSPPVELLTALIGAIAVLTFLARSIIVSRNERAAETTWRSQLEKIQKIEKDVVDRVDDTAFAELWATTQLRIDGYHAIATAQARRSFVGTQVATFAGFVIVIGLGVAAATAPSFAGSVTAATVAVIGGGISAYVGHTFMKSQVQAAAQLRQFFFQPVEFTRLLGAERLIETLPDADKAAAILKIIDKMTFSIDDRTSEN